MNYLKEAENIIASIPKLKQALENLNKRKDRLIAKSGPKDINDIDLTKPYVSSGYASDTLNDLIELSICTQQIKETKAKIKEIEDIINQLDNDKRDILILWHIQRKTKEYIAEYLDVESVTTVYNLHNKAIAEFALYYYGISAYK